MNTFDVEGEHVPRQPGLLHPVVLLGDSDGMSPRSSRHCFVRSSAATHPVLPLALCGWLRRRRR